MADESLESANEKQALKQLRLDVNRLLYQWDPLGMKGLRGGDREYDKYVGPVIVLVRRGAKHMEICAHLDRLVREEWKLPPQPEPCFVVSEKIHRAGALVRGDAS